MKRYLGIILCIVLLFVFSPLTVFADQVKETSLKTPYNLTVKQVLIDDMPYGGVELRFNIDNAPAAIQGSDPDSSADYWLFFEKKIGDGEWTEFGNNTIDMFGEGYGFEAPNHYIATDTWGEKSDDMMISYRVRMVIYDTVSVWATTPWSNVAIVGLKASSWAQPEIQKALSYGIVPDSIAGDYTQPITREEFAELAAKLYEVYTGNEATPAPASTFSDCTNPEVLKSSALGIVNGIGGGKFAPKEPTNREQIAAMLNRAIKALNPNADLSTTGAPVFSDENQIAPYFLENVKFMSKNGFIKGTNGAFNPKGTCTREMAVLIAVRVYEYYKK